MPNLKKICRICTFGIRHTKKSRQKFYGIFEECNLLTDIEELEAPLPYQIIQQFFNINFQIGKDDRLPSAICPNCIERFIEMHDLLKTCEKSQKILEKRFKIKLETDAQESFMENPSVNTDIKEEIIYNELDDSDIDKMEFEEIDIPKMNMPLIPISTAQQRKKTDFKECVGKNTNFVTKRTRTLDNKINSSNIDEYTNYEVLETSELSYQLNKIDKFDVTNDDYEFDNYIANNLDNDCNDNGNQDEERNVKFESDSEDDELVKQMELNFNTFTCQYCLLDFSTMDCLDDHVNRRHKTKLLISKIQCEDCGELIKRVDFQDHYQVKHAGKNPYYCEDCKKTYINMRTYRSHMNNIHSKDLYPYKTNFICHICNRTMFNKGALERHLKSHNANLIGLTSQREFHCKVCSMKFYNKTTMEQHHLDRHVLSANKDKYKHKCQECSRVFTRGDHLQIHIKREHLLDLPYKCQSCPRAFPVPNLLNRHIKLKHNEDYDERVKCLECGRILPDPRVLRRHVAEFHSDTPQFKCILCGLAFFKRALLQRHAKLHNIEGLSEEKIAELSKDYCASSVLATESKSTEPEETLDTTKFVEENIEEMEMETTIERVSPEDFEIEAEMLLEDLIEVDSEPRSPAPS